MPGADRRASARLAEAEADSPRQTAPRPRQVPARRQNTWNVLAEELISFPPASSPPPAFVGSARPVGPSAAGVTLAGCRRATPRSRGLRRLLPGAATLAVLASVWFGAGALSDAHRPALTVPAGAVKVSGGYRYVARPGDTLWSIASNLEPGGDPRILVAGFEQQLHGAELVPGDELRLP